MSQLNKQQQLRNEFEKLQDEAATLIALKNSILHANNIARNIGANALAEDMITTGYDYSSKFEQMNNAIKIGEYNVSKSIKTCGKTAGEALVGKCKKWEESYNELFASAKVGEELYNDIYTVAADLQQQIKMVKHAGKSLSLLNYLPQLTYYSKQHNDNLVWPYLLGTTTMYLNLIWYADTEEDMPTEFMQETDLDKHYNTMQDIMNAHLKKLQEHYGEIPTPSVNG